MSVRLAERGEGPLVGVLVGGEIFRAPGAEGYGLPAGFSFGWHSPHLVVALGLGFNVFIYDDIDDDAGFGLYAPFAAAEVGLELSPVFRLSADARGIYRWQWGRQIAVNCNWV